MNSRIILALPVAILWVALLAPPADAQGRGMRSFAVAPRGRSSFRAGGIGGLNHSAHRRSWNNSGYLFPPYSYSNDEFDSEPVAPEEPPVQVIVSPPHQPPAPPAKPIEPLLLENRDGLWVRVPTGSQMQTIQSPAKPGAASASSLQPGISGPAEAMKPLPELPPAEIVFRDGHSEEVQKYVIRGDALYTTGDYWSSGSWTRKIPLAELDIPASLKLNKERGAKFNLPSGPNEVVVRF
jgi:hypothetical protein